MQDNGTQWSAWPKTMNRIRGAILSNLLMPVGLALLLALSPQGVADAFTDASSRMEMQEYRDPAGYGLDVPLNWRIEDHSGRDALIRADILHGDDAGVQVRLLPRGHGEFAVQAGQLIDSYKDDMEGHWGGLLTELGRRSLPAGSAAVMVDFRAERNGGGLYLFEAFVELEGMVVFLQGGCPWEARDSFMRVVRAMVLSIRASP